MGEVVISKEGGKEIVQFEPQDVGIRIDAIDGARKCAKKLQDWESLSAAVDEQIKLQKALLAWWKANVERPGGDRQSEKHFRSTREMLSVAQAEAETKIKNQQVSRWKGYLEKPEDEAKYRTRLYGRPYQDAMGIPKGTKGTGVDEWYTPEEYLESVRLALGGIELDPASSDFAQKTINADRYFTILDNALEQEWQAKTVFLNPPYSAAKIADFVERLVAGYECGDIGAAIMLTNNFTDTRWFHRAAGSASAICFTRGRIRYYNADGDTSMPTNGQAFFYFGNATTRFAKHFDQWGFIR